MRDKVSFTSPRAFQPPLFDLRPEYTVRTPKRHGLYACQVWGETGYWLVGLYHDRTAARRAARAFLIDDPSEPTGAARPSNWVKRRSDGHAPRYKWVRKVKGENTWQARPWLGDGRGSLNLGLFRQADHGAQAEWAAAQVSKAFMREWKPGKTVSEVVEQLKWSKKANERVPAHVVVPVRQRDLLPPTNYGAVEDAGERRARAELERDGRRYPPGGLFRGLV